MRLHPASCHLEWSQVMFCSRYQTNVAEIRRGRDYRVEHVTKHGTVDLAVLDFSGTAGPRRVEDVGDVSEL